MTGKLFQTAALRQYIVKAGFSVARNMTSGPEWKHILLFGLPIMAGMFLQQMYNTVDGIVVGNFIDSDALAAVGSSTPLTIAFLAMATGMSNGSGVVIAQLFGAGKKTEMRRTASTAMIMLSVLGIFFTVLGIASAGFIMKNILNIEDPQICKNAALYFRIYAAGLIFQFIYNAVAGVLRAVGDSRATLYFLIISTVANMILDVVFVVFFRWGITGAAVATVISQIACMCASLYYMYKKYEDFRFRPGEYVFDKEKFRLCVKMGVPSTLQQLVVSSGHILLQRLINSFGSVTMAAYTVGSRFDHYLSLPSMGFLNAMASFTGQNTGAGRTDRIKRGIVATLGMNLTAVVILCALIYILAEPCAKLFGVDGKTLEQATEYLKYVAFIFPIFALYMPFNGLFQGAGNPVASMLISLIALSTKVAIAYIMVYTFDVGYSACWKANTYAWLVALAVSLIHYASGKWKNRAIVKKDPAVLQEAAQASGPSTGS